MEDLNVSGKKGKGGKKSNNKEDSTGVVLEVGRPL